jgi:hypothetical protein
MACGLEQALWDIETACAAIEAAVGAGDLEAAGLCNRDLHTRLWRFGKLLDESARPASEGSIEPIAGRLSAVLERRALLAQRLCGERDRALDELAEIRAGRHAANHYLDTAES